MWSSNSSQLSGHEELKNIQSHIADTRRYLYAQNIRVYRDTVDAVIRMVGAVVVGNYP